MQKLNKEISKKKNIKGAFLFFALLFCTFSFGQKEKKPKDLSEIVKTWAQPDVYPDHIVLSAAEDPTTAIGINWRTSPTYKAGYVEIAISNGTPYFSSNSQRIEATKINYDTSKDQKNGFVSTFYGITIKELKPNTLYAYRVGNDAFKSEWFQFKTAGVSKNEPYSFIYVGDAQNYILELWSRLIRTAFKTMPEAKFIIHAGDLVNYAHSETEWNDWFDAGGFIHSEIPTIAVPGNHEYQRLNKKNVEDEKVLSVQWQPQFSFPENGPKKLKETCYFIDYPDLKVIALNSNLEIRMQGKWLKKVLAENDKKWTVVTYHHPAFSASRKEGNEEVIKFWKPLFEEYNVDLALQGHDHAYARGAVYNEKFKSEFLKGPVYVVSVSGGKMYPLSSEAEGWEGFGAVKNKKGQYLQLFQVITIDDNQLFYKSYTASGQLFDSFRLEKKEGKTQYFK